MEIPKLITGLELNCSNWQIEGALRMLRNNIAQAARPEDLVVYGEGKTARNWDCFHAIERCLRALTLTQTLLVQSGKPVGIVETHEDAPRVLIVNSFLVPRWCNDEMFRHLEDQGLTMYGQMTAGSWAFIGAQGIMQGTYETFAAAGAGPGKLLVSGGLGNMGNAQAVAARMCGAVGLIAEIDPAKIARCMREGWVNETYGDLPRAVTRALRAKEAHQAVAIAVQCNVVDLLDYLVRENITPDVLTDQTAAHDPLRGYFPQGLSFAEALDLRQQAPAQYIMCSRQTMARHVRLMLALQERGATTFDYGNGIRFHAQEMGVENAFDVRGFVPLYIRPLFCQGRGPFRVAALSGDPADIAVVDEIILNLFRDNKMLCNWIEKAQREINFSRQPGLPARVCWLGMGERALAIEHIWRAVKDGRISAPIWSGRDHLDGGSVASPGRETEAMADGSDAVADWPILNALVSCASGATWTSVHDGGGVGHGKSTHAGQCVVITPDEACLKRALRVLTNDPLLAILRHADAGYPEAIEAAAQHGIVIPMPRD